VHRSVCVQQGACIGIAWHIVRVALRTGCTALCVQSVMQPLHVGCTLLEPLGVRGTKEASVKACATTGTNTGDPRGVQPLWEPLGVWGATEDAGDGGQCCHWH
jgi:hypothetical protein